MKSFKEIREGVKDLKNYKDRDRKGHEAYMSVEVVKGNTSNKFDDDFGFSQAEMGVMDKVIGKIKKMHISSFDGGDSAPASMVPTVTGVPSKSPVSFAAQAVTSPAIS